MRSGYVDLAYLLLIGAVCGGIIFLLPEHATSIQLFDTYLVFARWQWWLLLTVVITFLFFATKQALTGFRSPMGNRFVVASGFFLVPLLTVISREGAALWAKENQFVSYDLLQQRTWQIQFIIVAYMVYVGYQWGSREK